MEYVFFICAGGAIFFCLTYSLIILSYCIGWIKTGSQVIAPDLSVSVSVIIAARNEEKNIINCLNSVTAQLYSAQGFEVIVVDDASTDATNKLIAEFCKKNTAVSLITLSENSGNTGKKAAITSAIKIAKGELIITTDADCIMDRNWLSSVVNCYSRTRANMIVAPVSFYDEQNTFQKMQSLEFMALMSSGGASLYYHKAIMCNGANLAYTKQVFNEVNGFEGISDNASGDDVLLMYKIGKKYPGSIHFLKDREAIVYTKPKSTLQEFLDQRRRWASKDFSLLNAETKAVSLVVYLFNFMLLLLPVMGLLCPSNNRFHGAFFEICLILLGIKCFIDFLLLFLAASFFKKRWLLVYFLPEQFIYIFYIVIVGLLGKTGKYKWKGRTIK